MAILDNSQGMEYGQDYTFTFKLSAYGVPVSLDEIIQALSKLQDLSSVSVTESQTGAVGLTLAGGDWDVSFSFVGDDTTATVGSVAAEISSAVGSTHWLVSFSLVQAFTGDTGIVKSGDADKGLNTADDLAKSFSKDLLYIGIAIVLVVVALKFA